MIENITNIIDKFKRMTTKELETYKVIAMFAIVADLFGVWYYLQLKTLGGALLIVLIIGLAVILFLEQNSKGGEKMEENNYLDLTGEKPKLEKEEPKPEEKEEKEDKSDFGNFEFGMPTPESCANALK